MPPKMIQEMCNELRSEILRLGNDVKGLHKHEIFECEQTEKEDRNEMRANITLAYRHLEDARMRLGKVIQAHEGGVSRFDK